jgi:uncharacterized protein (UPF0303 family)
MNEPLPEFTLEQLETLADVDLAHFSKEDAWQLGTTAAAVIQARSLNLAVDIVIDGDLVFRAKFGTTGPGNDQWLAGKAAVAMHFGEPSLRVRRRYEAGDTPFTDLDLDHDRLKAHGGSIPIRVSGNLVGTITMSGEPDVVDHDACAEAVTRYLASLG